MQLETKSETDADVALRDPTWGSRNGTDDHAPHPEELMSKRLRLSRRHDYRPIPKGRERHGSLVEADPTPSERRRGAANAERLAALDPLGDAIEEAD